MKTVYSFVIFTFSIYNAFSQAPANDECSGAIPFNTVPHGVSCSATISANTAGATKSSPNPSCTGKENDDDIWYRFTPGTSTILLQFGDATNNATGNEAIIGFALYESGCKSSAVNLVCNAIGSAGRGYIIINNLDTGVQHYLRFWSTLTGTNTATFEFCVQEILPVQNDDCNNALPVFTQPPGTNCDSGTHASTLGATRSGAGSTCLSGFEDDDIWYSFTAATNAIEIRFSNAVQITGSLSRTNIGYALYEANCPASGEPFSCASNIGAGSGIELVGGLTPGSTYYLRLYSYAQNLYAEFDFCLVDVNLVANDECANAITLTTSSGFCTNPQAGTLEFATTSPGMGAPACVGLSTSEDVWFRTAVPQSGSLIVQTSLVERSTNNLIMEAYSGTCGNLTLLTCDDDGNSDPGRSSLHSKIELSGRTPGETIFLRVLGFGSINKGKFVICAWDASDITPISPGGNCIESVAAIIDSSNLNLYRWVPFLDNSGNIIAELYADGSELGNTKVSVFVNTGEVRSINGNYYLDRNITVESEQPGNAYVRFYFRNNEFQSLQDSVPAISSVEDLQITRSNEDCNSLFTSSSAVIIPDTKASYGNDFVLEFRTSGFSTFFINQVGHALPLKFLSFDASSNGKNYELNWAVVKDPALKEFDIQQSNDGSTFNTIASVDGESYVSNNNSQLSYRFGNSLPAKRTYFRIVMKETTDELVYSKIINIEPGRIEVVHAYPNPASNIVNIQSDINSELEFVILSASGQVVKKGFKKAGENWTRLNISDLRNGIYMVRMFDRKSGTGSFTRVIKL